MALQACCSQKGGYEHGRIFPAFTADVYRKGIQSKDLCGCSFTGDHAAFVYEACGGVFKRYGICGSAMGIPVYPVKYFLSTVIYDWNLFAFSYETMQMFTPFELIALTVVIGTLEIGFMGLFMFAVSIYIGRSAAVTAAFVMALMIYLVENIHPLLREKMAMFVPVNWMRVTQIGVKLHDSFIQPPVFYMLMALVAGIAVCAVLILIKIRKMEFQWYKEE